VQPFLPLTADNNALLQIIYIQGCAASIRRNQKTAP